MMKYYGLILALVASFVLSSNALAQEKETSESFAPKAEKVVAGTSINFAEALGLNAAALVTLGKKIEDARDEADPVALVAVAKVLQAAEQTSGKTAGLTADTLTKEAIDLAKIRGSSAELTLLASILGGPASADLKKLAKVAADKEDEQLQAIKDNTVTKDLHGTLRVHNHSHEFFRLYANGRYLGYIRPHGHRSFHVHGVHYVDARNRYHRIHRHIHGHRHFYNFYIHVHH